jgi:hypothetical protein
MRRIIEGCVMGCKCNLLGWVGTLSIVLYICFVSVWQPTEIAEKSQHGFRRTQSSHGRPY